MKIIGSLWLLFITCVFAIPTFSQEGTPLITPTPAPSKTPIAANTSTPETETSTPVSQIVITEPYTQSDLSVLTGNVQRPNGIASYNGKLYTACNGDWTLYEVDDSTGSTRTFIYGVRNAHTLYVEESEEAELSLWIPDYDTNSLLLVNQSRAPKTIVSDLEGPWGIGALDENQFIISNLIGNNVIITSRDGDVITLNSEMRSPAGIAVDDEHVYIANNGSSRRSIEWSAKEDLIEDNTEFRPLVSGLQNTTGLVMAPDGLLYFTYALGTRGVVGRVDPEECRENGGCTNDQVEIVLYTELAAPLAGLTISSDMRLFVHTIFSPEIYWVQLGQED